MFREEVQEAHPDRRRFTAPELAWKKDCKQFQNGIKFLSSCVSISLSQTDKNWLLSIRLINKWINKATIRFD
jgi:hypothetical protein